jgi:hypothetical protein
MAIFSCGICTGVAAGVVGLPVGLAVLGVTTRDIFYLLEKGC